MSGLLNLILFVLLICHITSGSSFYKYGKKLSELEQKLDKVLKRLEK